MKQRIFTFAAVGFFVCASISSAMTSTNFEIRWDTVSTGGSDSASSSSYLLRDTAETTLAGSASSSTYQLDQGYRSGVDDQIMTFEVFAQTSSSSRSATALSGLTVTASTSGISVGDLIAVVQDLGASQISAVGRVTSLGAGTITVDAWKDAGTTPTIDGTNDVVYPVTASSIALGELSTSTVTTAIITFEVTAANDNGYVVQVIEDGNLRSGGNDIDDVTDGSVTAGSEEYGARSSDTTLSNSTFDTADAGITTSFQLIASESSASFESRNFITIKAAISSSTNNASYSHIVSLVASGSF
jgi:hypothetical protein